MTFLSVLHNLTALRYKRLGRPLNEDQEEDRREGKNKQESEVSTVLLDSTNENVFMSITTADERTVYLGLNLRSHTHTRLAINCLKI